MEILIISNFLEQPESNDLDQFNCITWESKAIGPLSTFDAIIIDMTYKDNDKDNEYSQNAKRLLYDLSIRLSKTGYLHKTATILAVVCSAEEESFNADRIPDDDASGVAWQKEVFSNYEYLKRLMFTHEANCYYEEIGYKFIIPLTPSTAYLAMFKNNLAHLCYQYSDEKEECSFIRPLAKPKEVSMEVASFECIIGRGMIIVLPAYDLSRKDDARNELIKMCKIHHNQRYTSSRLNVFDKIDSEKLARLFEEAYLCFKHGLYIATVTMCRRVLEESLTERGGNPKHLETMIDKMLGRGEITQKQHDIAHLVREFGNDGAHYRKELVTEIKAYDALQFLEYYFTAENQNKHIEKSKGTA